jgi:predicted PhzF superfamily epimerase YddE/YHI9
VRIPVEVVDAFTGEPFAGNPAAVVRLDAWPSDDWLSKVASEMSLSETAFLVSRPDGDLDLRWFTPTVEVDLCGHATLASAHVLGGSGRFHTRSGLLTCTRRRDGWIEMDFPKLPAEPAVCPAGLRHALGNVEVHGVYQSRFDLLVEVASAEVVRTLRPDIRAITELDARGVIVTAGGDRPGIDVVSRFFAPRAGVDEDPVTGSAHCVIAPFWAERLGRTELTAEQASVRGGIVGLRIEDDRVVLAGQAVTTWRGELLIPPPVPSV